MAGSISATKSKELHFGFISTLNQAQFHLREWTSSGPELVLSLPPEYKDLIEKFKVLDEEHTIKILEITGNPLFDTFRFTISKSKSLKTESITTSQILRDIAQTFDPHAWSIHVIISPKCLMQKA